jgi:DNA-binding NarL/FixJ family response regulator
MHAHDGLILTRHILPAYQIRSVLEYDAMAADIVMSDLDVYARLSHRAYGFLICDIDDADVHGIAVAEWFRFQSRGAPWYAICRYGNSRNMRLAREKGASGYFFLNSAGMALDPHAGMTHALLRRQQGTRQAPPRHTPHPHQPQPSF